MGRFLAMNSDITKHRIKFPISVIVNTYKEKWADLTVSHISHDMTRPFGWNCLTNIVINNQNVSLYGNVFIDINSEVYQLAKSKLERELGTISESNKKLLSKLLDEESFSRAEFHNEQCERIISDGIVRSIYPALFEKQDNDGLINIRDLQPISPGVFDMGDGYIVFAHSYFRRNCSQVNNLNIEFLEKIEKLSNTTNLNIRIRIDEDSIGVKDTLRTPIELEYWWGPKFSNDLPEIKLGTARHQASEDLKFFHSIESTDFFWSLQDGQLTFEVEELRDANAPSLGISNHNFACRYVHSIALNDISFHHLDGAVRIYDDEQYLKRLEAQDISHSDKNSDYQKLWRIDKNRDLQDSDNIEIDVWKELICHYYRDNSLPGEYFDGKEDERSNSINSRDNQNTGIDFEISLFYCSKKDNTQAESLITIIPTSYIKTENYDYPYLEYETLDLIKLLKRNFSFIDADHSNYTYLAIEDMDINYPIILFTGADSINNATRAMQQINLLFIELQRVYSDRFITLHFGIEYLNEIKYFSFGGHVSKYLEILDKNFQFPKENNLKEWAEELYDLLHGSSQMVERHEEYFELRSTNLLNFSRVILPSNYAEIYVDDHGNVSYKIEDKKDDPFIEKINRGKGCFIMSNIIEKVHCIGCNKDYFKCACINDLEHKKVCFEKFYFYQPMFVRNSSFHQ